MVRICDWFARQNCRVTGLDNITQDVGIIILKGGGASSKGTASAHKIAKCIYLSICLPQNLRDGVQVMAARTARQMKLISAEGISFSGNSLGRFFNERQISARNLTWPGLWQLIDKYDFRAERFHHAGTFH